MIDGEKKPTYKRLCKTAEKTVRIYKERGYNAKAIKFPATERIIIIIDAKGG